MGIQINGTNDTISAADGSLTVNVSEYTVGSGTSIFSPETNVLTLGTNNSERVRITSNGYMLSGSSTSRSSFFSGAASALYQNEIAQTSGVMNISVTNNGAEAGFVFGRTGGTTVGSNTIAPTDAGIGYIDFHASNGTNMSPAGRISCNLQGTPSGSSMPGRLVFHTTPSGSTTLNPRMYITSSGNVLINATAETAKLYAYNTTLGQSIYGWSEGTGTYYGGVFQASLGAHTQYGVYGYVNTTSTYSSGGGLFYSINSNTYGIVGYWSGSSYWSFYGNGSAYIGGTYQGSDERLKDIVEPLVGVGSTITILDKISNITAVKYRWKEGSQQRRSMGDDIHIGLIAQQVEEYFPELIKEIENPVIAGANPETLNEQLGNTKSLQYNNMVAVLLEALKEAKTRIEILESKVSSLEAK